MRRWLVVAALVALASCSRSRGPVLIAAAGNWNESYGEMNKRGIDLALEEINQRGGAGGRPIQLLSRDDKGDGTRAVNIAAEFLANTQVVAVVGHVNSGTMVAAARVYNEGLPAVSTTASTPDLTGISPWVFRVISSDSVNGLDLARFARSLGFTRAAILMFGTRESLLNLRSQHLIDFRLVPDGVDESKQRWDHRIAWEGNLYDAFFKIYPRLIEPLKTPFKLEGPHRLTETEAHEALRESLVNMLAHAGMRVELKVRKAA